MRGLLFPLGYSLLLVPFGYVLTFGRFGFPEMGAGGLGVASALMMWGQALGFALYLWRTPRFADLGLFARFDRPHGASLRRLLANGSPMPCSPPSTLASANLAFNCGCVVTSRVNKPFRQSHINAC